jgi:adenine-specific DNA methylase
MVGQTKKSFIEEQLPVSKLSCESYKERMAGSGQTLTGLGKWWGRKPLVLVRAVILGCLLPATDDPKRDRDIFLKLMTMDGNGLLKRKKTALTPPQVAEALSTNEREKCFIQDSKGKWLWKKGLSREEKKRAENRAFLLLSYEERLRYTLRPEEIDGPNKDDWNEINDHLGTTASSLSQLVEQLGYRQYERTPYIGDVFCGGGSIPFEAARLGCQVHASDLNPVACLLTWGALKLLDMSENEALELSKAQEELQQSVEKQIIDWGIEHNNKGWRADTLLYCIEAPCPECGWTVPLAPSWVISQKQRIICKLLPEKKNRSFQFKIEEAYSEEEFKNASKGTVGDKKMQCPNCGQSIAITTLRGDRKTVQGTENNLRCWEKCDFQPRKDDLYQERLYCIRWVVPAEEKGGRSQRIYAAPTKEDLQREKRVVDLLNERFTEWQESGYIPSRPIESGNKTDEPIRTRGWTYWHHLFNPRQMLKLGLEYSTAFKYEQPNLILKLTRNIDYSNKLCRWTPNRETVNNNFSNQALNVIWNYGCKIGLTETNISICERNSKINNVELKDARQIKNALDIAITDPPYADAVNYDELSEFFLSWLEPHIKKLFPDWYTDSKRALAIRGNGESFNKSMVACYRNLTEQMPDNGMQVIMFTHQDASVWANLALILWAAGLHVTAAWTIATETTSALKTGNYVQGTVIMVCRKRLSTETVFLDELHPLLEEEVARQVRHMEELDDAEEPNFGDSDYQLAAYAAALRVLTAYGNIEDIDVEKELTRSKASSKDSPVVKLIEEAVAITSDFRIPESLSNDVNERRELWRRCGREERFFLRGLELERHGELRQGVYQEFARSFGLKEYTHLLASQSKANGTRLKTASELARRCLEKENSSEGGFGGSHLRQLFFALYVAVKADNAKSGLTTLKEELGESYWKERKRLILLARYLSQLPTERMPHWRKDSHYASLLEGLILNDGVY